MRILAADDEPLALAMLTEAIKEASPESKVDSFSMPSSLLEFARENPCDIAFLDIQMRGMTGLELAKKLKELRPDINIIFVTGYESYSFDAMAMHASGYVLKPVTKEKIFAELFDLRKPVPPQANTLLRIKCFGNFDVSEPDGTKVYFGRSKAKELLAYLIYRSGASCSIREIASVLFENSEYDKKQQSYTQKIISSMMQTLKTAQAESIIIKRYNSLAINVELVDCDYYRFTQLDTAAINTYTGEFMSQYSWAEFIIGYLEDIQKNAF